MNEKIIDEKWKKLVEKASGGNIVDLGSLSVGMVANEDSSVSIILSDSFDLSFEMCMPDEVSRDIKEALIMFEAMADPSVDVTDPEVFKSVLQQSYEESLLPFIGDSLREVVKDYPSMSIVKVIMSYLDMISGAMDREGCVEAFIGPDGVIYVNDSMPYEKDEIIDGIICSALLSRGDSEKLMKWIVSVASEYSGIFPGMITEKSGCSVKVTVHNDMVVQSFILAMDIVSGNHVDDSLSFEEFPQLFTVEVKGIDELIDETLALMCDEYPLGEVNVIKMALTKAVDNKDEIVPWDDLFESVDREVSARMQDILIQKTVDGNGMWGLFESTLEGLRFNSQ